MMMIFLGMAIAAYAGVGVWVGNSAWQIPVGRTFAVAAGVFWPSILILVFMGALFDFVRSK